MQKTTKSMFAQLIQLMGGKIEFQNHYQSDKGAYDVEPIYRNAFLPTRRGGFLTGDFRRPLFHLNP